MLILIDYGVIMNKDKKGFGILMMMRGMIQDCVNNIQKMIFSFVKFVQNHNFD